MFNKIVASVISSVVLFACNMKDEAPVTAADVVDVADVGASAEPAVSVIAPNAPQPVVPTTAPASTQEVVASPLVVNGAGVAATSATAAGLTTPASVVMPVTAPVAPSAAAPTSTTTAK